MAMESINYLPLRRAKGRASEGEGGRQGRRRHHVLKPDDDGVSNLVSGGIPSSLLQNPTLYTLAPHLSREVLRSVDLSIPRVTNVGR